MKDGLSKNSAEAPPVDVSQTDESFLTWLFISMPQIYQFLKSTVQTQHTNALCQSWLLHHAKKRTMYTYSFLRDENTGQTWISTELQCLAICPNSALNPFTGIKKRPTAKVISVDMEECSTFYYFSYWIKDFAMYSKALEGFLMKESYKRVFEVSPLWQTVVLKWKNYRVWARIYKALLCWIMFRLITIR